MFRGQYNCGYKVGEFVDAVEFIELNNYKENKFLADFKNKTYIYSFNCNMHDNYKEKIEELLQEKDDC